MIHPAYPRQRGFTLVEMAVVLMIIGLLLGGLIPTLNTQMETQRLGETRRQLEDIQQALTGFALANGRLPCAADPTIPSGQPGAGLERAQPCTNANSSGVLPWATLGLNETDAWGNRFTYRVTAAYADNIDGAGSACAVTAGVSFQLCSTATLNVLSSTGGPKVAVDVPVVVISHGKNGNGAWTPQGTQHPMGSDADEQENADGIADTDYVHHPPTTAYDDLVVWLSPAILSNRMVAAGKLP